MDSDDDELIGEGATAPAPCRSSSVRVFPLLHFRPHALVAQGIEHRCPNRLGGLAYHGETAESLTVLAFSPLTVSHHFSCFHFRCGPGAAQDMARAFVIEPSGDEYATRTSTRIDREPVRRT